MAEEKKHLDAEAIEAVMAKAMVRWRNNSVRGAHGLDGVIVPSREALESVACEILEAANLRDYLSQVDSIRQNAGLLTDSPTQKSILVTGNTVVYDAEDCALLTPAKFDLDCFTIPPVKPGFRGFEGRAHGPQKSKNSKRKW